MLCVAVSRPTHSSSNRFERAAAVVAGRRPRNHARGVCLRPISALSRTGAAKRSESEPTRRRPIASSHSALGIETPFRRSRTRRPYAREPRDPERTCRGIAAARSRVPRADCGRGAVDGSDSAQRPKPVEPLVGRAEMSAVLIDRYCWVRDVRRQPRSVGSRYEHVRSAVPNLNGRTQLSDVESPRRDEREVIVHPAPDALGEHLAR
jgi:hypothetical protein